MLNLDAKKMMGGLMIRSSPKWPYVLSLISNNNDLSFFLFNKVITIANDLK